MIVFCGIIIFNKIAGTRGLTRGTDSGVASLNDGFALRLFV